MSNSNYGKKRMGGDTEKVLLHAKTGMHMKTRGNN